MHLVEPLFVTCDVAIRFREFRALVFELRGEHTDLVELLLGQLRLRLDGFLLLADAMDFL